MALRRLLISSVLVGTLLSAAATMPLPCPLTTTDRADFRSLAEYREMESSLKQAAMLGDAKAAYGLGLLYSKEIVLFDGGRVPANPDRAKKHLEGAFEKGVDLAALQLASIEVSDGNPAGGLHAIDRAFKRGVAAKPDRLLLAAKFAAIVLDYFPNNSRAVKKAVSYLGPVADAETPTALYILANLYRIAGDMGKANDFLNKACTNRKAPDELRNLCFNSDAIDAEKITKELR